jgi:hypothetical protein
VSKYISSLHRDAQELATALTAGEGMDALEVIFGGGYSDPLDLAQLLRITAEIVGDV